MASQAVDQVATEGGRGLRHRPVTVFSRGVAANRSLNTLPLRLVIAGVGGVLSLGLGVAAASAVRLPPEIRDGYVSPDQTTLRDELPWVTAARAFAADNPPPYVVTQTTELAPTRSDLFADQPVVKDSEAVDKATPTGVSPSNASDDDVKTAERQDDVAAATPA